MIAAFSFIRGQVRSHKGLHQRPLAWAVGADVSAKLSCSNHWPYLGTGICFENLYKTGKAF